MWATYKTPITSKQTHRKSPVSIPWLLLRPVFDAIGRLARPFDIASVMKQKSIVLYLHLKRTPARATHDDLGATLDSEAPAYSTVTKHLRTARVNPVKDPPNPDASSPHLDHSDQAILATL
jgi:hypothetical protein